MRTLFFASLAQKGQRKVIKAVKCCFIAVALGLSSHATQAQDQTSVILEGATISLQAAPVIAQSLLAETITLADDERLIFLSVDLNEGWKTYWRLPGRFGLAPKFDWQDSENLAQARIIFPEPHLFDEADGQSIGYDAPTLWPVVLRAARPDAPVHLRLDLEIGLCADLCLPERATLSGFLSELISGPTPSMAQLFDLTSELPSEPAPLLHATFSQTGDVLRTETPDGKQDGAFAIAENGRHHTLLLPVDGQTALAGLWSHEAPATKLTIVFEDRRMQVFAATPHE